LLTAKPLLRLISKNISWLSGSEVIQHAYFGCDGENAIILKEDCFSVWGNLKCLISESLFFKPYKLRSRKFSFFIFSQIAMWFLFGDIAIHYIVSIWSDSLMNSMNLLYIDCFTIVLPIAYTIFILESYSIIPISFLFYKRKFDPKEW
jgi:hypothetical protein